MNWVSASLVGPDTVGRCGYSAFLEPTPKCVSFSLEEIPRRQKSYKTLYTENKRPKKRKGKKTSRSLEEMKKTRPVQQEEPHDV